MKNLCFYYQVWYKNKRSIYEALKRLRKIYPNDELILVIAGIEQSEIETYHNNFTEKLKNIFNITIIDYITIEEFPEMLGNTLRVEQNQHRDKWLEFSTLWLDKMVKLPSKNIDILIACSDDWMIADKIPFNYDIDASGMISGTGEWMNEKTMREYFQYNLPLLNFIWWPASGCYMNFKKFKQGYNEKNKKYVKEFITNTYSPTLGMYTDFVCGLWILYLFDSFINSSYISHYNTADHVITKYGGKREEDEQTIDEYPEEVYQKTPFISLHSYKTFRNMPISDEMKLLGIK